MKQLSIGKALAVLGVKTHNNTQTNMVVHIPVMQ
jgi:hypothetical protein